MTKSNPEKGIIYYTDSELDESIARPVRIAILEAGLPVVSVSLKPMEHFGENYFLNKKRGYITMMRQIILALEKSTAKYVFFCEHDVLYSKSHFDFTPPRDDIFYYDENVWRWLAGSKMAVTHDRMLPLSVMCCNRELALRFYKHRWEEMEKVGLKKFSNSQADIIRKWGFEPGTKKKKRGGLTDDDFETWKSAEPTLDIRHNKSFSPPKCTLSSFKHKPENWREIEVEKLFKKAL